MKRYLEHQLARIYILSGEHEKALDRLEPLHELPRFAKLVEGTA